MPWALGLWALFVGLTLAAVVPGSGASEPAAKAKPLCGGKRAGILGRPRRDALAGTGRADVMAGLAASDYLDRRGGDDLEPGDRALFTAVDVGGKTVTVVLESSAAVFDAFAERAAPVLASIRFSTP